MSSRIGAFRAYPVEIAWPSEGLPLFSPGQSLRPVDVLTWLEKMEVLDPIGFAELPHENGRALPELGRIEKELTIRGQWKTRASELGTSAVGIAKVGR